MEIQISKDIFQPRFGSFPQPRHNILQWRAPTNALASPSDDKSMDPLADSDKKKHQHFKIQWNQVGIVKFQNMFW